MFVNIIIVKSMIVNMKRDIFTHIAQIAIANIQNIGLDCSFSAF